MPCTKPRPGLPADIKFNPANGSRAEIDADGVMSRLEAGITKRKAFDRLGGLRLFKIYCDQNPDWAKRANALIERNAEAARWRKGAKHRDRTHCKRGHPFADENNVVMVKREYGRMYYRTCRMCIQEREKNWPNRLTDEQMNIVTKGMQRKMTIDRIRKLVDIRRIYKERKLNPEFEKLYQAWLAGFRERAAAKVVKTCKTRRYTKIDAMIPKKYTGDMRLELINMIYVALSKRAYRGKDFFLTNLASNLKHFVSDYYKHNPVNAYGKIDSPWSLDAPVSYENDTKLVDTVSRGLWD
jgi:hypothetical protein